MPAEPQLVLGNDLAVRAGGIELARYVIEPVPKFESPRPYRISSIAVSNIYVEAVQDEVNLWGGVTWVPGHGYKQLANNGSQRHDGWESVSERRVVQRLSWCTATQRVFLAEKRAVSASNTADADGWQLATTSTWMNMTDRQIRFGSPTTAGRPNAGYGGFFLRGSAALLEAHVALDGERLSAAEAQGRTGSTMILTGTRAPVTVALSDSPSNPVTPTCWFVRTEPMAMLCAAPFFHTEWALPARSTATWSWHLRVTDIPRS